MTPKELEEALEIGRKLREQGVKIDPKKVRKRVKEIKEQIKEDERKKRK